MKAPFKKGDQVEVPGRYRNMVVETCFHRRNDWIVIANFESGNGFYEGPASEFVRRSVPKKNRNRRVFTEILLLLERNASLCLDNEREREALAEVIETYIAMYVAEGKS